MPGWEDDPLIETTAANDDAQPWASDPVVEHEIKEAEQEKVPETDWLRRAALGGRAAAEGVVNTFTALADSQTGVENSFRGVLGLPQIPTLSQQFSDLMDRAGAYTPQGKSEEMQSAVIRGTTGALTGGGASGVSSVPNAIRTALGGVAGSAAAEWTKQQGYNRAVQVAAGLAGGVSPMALEEVPRLIVGAGRVGLGLARPLLRSGQEQIAADVLARQTTDVPSAVRNLSAAQPNIPGSDLTSGAASRDIGLIALEKGLRSRASARFGQRLSEQNLARQTALDRVGGTEADVLAGQRGRDAATAPMREQALAAGQTVGAPSQYVVDHIDEMLASPIGHRDVASGALRWVRDKINRADLEPANLYAVRQDIGDAMEGRLGGDQAAFRLARRELLDVRGVLDDAIEAGAPGFQAYMNRYRELSRPINQMEVLQEIQRRSALAAPDVTTGRDFLSQAKFRNELIKAHESGDLDTLSAEQLRTINAVATDLDMGAATTSSLVRAPGSDTFQNLSIAAATRAGGIPGADHALGILTRSLRWLYRGSDERINELLVDAMMDPRLAARMLQRATPARVQAISATLRSRFGANVVGVAGATAAQPSGSPTGLP